MAEVYISQSVGRKPDTHIDYHKLGSNFMPQFSVSKSRYRYLPTSIYIRSQSKLEKVTLWFSYNQHNQHWILITYTLSERMSNCFTILITSRVRILVGGMFMQKRRFNTYNIHVVPSAFQKRGLVPPVEIPVDDHLEGLFGVEARLVE